MHQGVSDGREEQDTATWIDHPACIRRLSIDCKPACGIAAIRAKAPVPQAQAFGTVGA
jgi:hypothetical protein